MTAQKAFLGSEPETMELLGRPEEKSVPPMPGRQFALQEN